MQFVRPCVFGITLLAVSVALWGYSYRLSLYRQQPDQALRIPAAKLFVEHRNAARVSMAKACTPPLAAPAVPELPLRLPQAKLDPVCPIGLARRAATAGTPVPLRSPPSLSSSTS